MKTPLDHWREKFESSKSAVEKEKYSKEWIVLVGSATCEIAAGSNKVYDSLKKELSGLNDIYLGITGCTGSCVSEPIVQIIKRGAVPVRYKNVKPDDVKSIVEQHIKKGIVIKELELTD